MIKVGEGFSIEKVVRGLNLSNLTRENRALSLTIGFFLSLFPLMGVTTILNLLASLLFRLNLAITQGLNFLLMPLQLLLMYPFFYVGRILFFPENKTILSLSLAQLTKGNQKESFILLFESFIGGVLVWILFSIVSGFFIYQLFIRINFKKLSLQLTRLKNRESAF